MLLFSVRSRVYVVLFIFLPILWHTEHTESDLTKYNSIEMVKLWLFLWSNTYIYHLIFLLLLLLHYYLACCWFFFIHSCLNIQTIYYVENIYIYTESNGLFYILFLFIHTRSLKSFMQVFIHYNANFRFSAQHRPTACKPFSNQHTHRY